MTDLATEQPLDKDASSDTGTSEFKEVNAPNEDGSRDVDFYNIFDGTKGRPNGRYLDMDERVEAEKTRAIREGREPRLGLDDLGKLPPGVGTPVVVEAQRVDNSVHSNPATATYNALGLVKDVDPILTSTVPVEGSTDNIDTAYAEQVTAEGGKIMSPDIPEGTFQSPVAATLSSPLTVNPNADENVPPADVTADKSTAKSKKTPQ